MIENERYALHTKIDHYHFVIKRLCIGPFSGKKIDLFACFKNVNTPTMAQAKMAR